MVSPIVRIAPELEVVQLSSVPMTDAPSLYSDICRQGYEYWRSTSIDGVARRKDIHPFEIRDLLPYLYFLDASQDRLDFRYRLIGTDITANTTDDNTGLWLSSIAGIGSQGQLLRLFQTVAVTGTPHAQRIGYRTEAGYRSFYETIVAPMRRGSDGIDSLFGAAEHFTQAIPDPI